VPGKAESAPAGDHWYDYAVLRVVPHVEREEFVNVGVILFARTLRYLGVRIELDEARLRALWPSLDIAFVKEHLRSYEAVVAGDAGAGPIAALSQSERFHWLTSPRSTIIQTSPVHVGRCSDPERAVEELMDELVRPPKPA
jgi:hypothetical protein